MTAKSLKGSAGWDGVEARYAARLVNNDHSLRLLWMALEALLIQERLSKACVLRGRFQQLGPEQGCPEL